MILTPRPVSVFVAANTNRLATGQAVTPSEVVAPGPGNAKIVCVPTGC